MADALTIESSGDVAILRLDDGKANALSPAVLEALSDGFRQAGEASQAVLLAGRPGRFSAGFDLGVMREKGPLEARAMVTAGARLALQIARHPAPVVIECTGHALAMGAVLLMSSDLRIGASGDSKIGFNEVAIGMTTPIFLMEFARERISKRHFMRSVVLAEIHDPGSAVDAGFLDRTASPDALHDEALAATTQLAKLPRGALLRTRKLARGGTLELIERTLEDDMAGAFPAKS